MKKKRILLAVNIIMLLFVLYAWLRMFFDIEESRLSSRGFTNLKYYTTLSNIFAGIVAAVWLVKTLRKKDVKKLWLWKYISACAVGLTFLVVLGFLGPLYGFGTMYVRSNFFFHLVVPLMAMAEFLIFNERETGRKDNRFVIIPPLLYGTVYVTNAFINGIAGNDIYGFLNWGYPVGGLIFAVICLVIWLVGLLLRKGNEAIRRVAPG
ncbi:MAG: hypothetical protein K6E50_12385 [Lachnospiraceae bacterium]|nr:hypothetical protein [Lachnospiraceae bacterium]